MFDEVFPYLDEAYTVKLSEEMIEIPSVTGNEEELALYIQEKLESYGMHTELQYVADGRPNVYGTIEWDKPGKKLNYNAHTDTVPAGDDWETDPFKAVIKGEKLYGRGACDMKTGIACSLNMIKAIADSGVELNGELSFSGVIDQETTDIGA